MVSQALKTLQTPDGIHVAMYTPHNLLTSDTARTQAGNADVIIVDVMIDELTDFLRNEVDIGKKRVYAVRASRDDESLRKRGIIFDDDIRQFYHHLRPTNVQSLILEVARREFDRFILHGRVKTSPELGLYHPDAPGTFTDPGRYFEWYGKRDGFRTDAPTVAVMIYKANVDSGGMEHIDYVIRRLEKAGFSVMTAFGWDPDVLTTLMRRKDGRPWMDAVVSFSLKFQSALDEKVFAILRELDVPIFNMLNLYYTTIDEWKADPRGVAPMEVGWAITNPELSGLVEPTVATGKVRKREPHLDRDIYLHKAIQENLEVLVPRLAKWIALRKKPNREKRVVILFYNNSPGKQNLGASYLNVFASLSCILDRLARDGYRVESKRELTHETIRDLILTSGRNVGAWAPGELEQMLRDETIARVSVETYKKWFADLPEAFRTRVIEQWGPVDESTIMIQGREFIIPGIRLGNIMLMPEPSRGYNDDPMKLYHSPTLYPHHQYVAAYLWMKHVFGADAQIHLGTHGTHEWLPGKQAGLSPACPPDVLITDIPSLYPYIVDDVGEGIQAKRRGRAAVIDHLIPGVKEGGLYHEYSKLYEMISTYYGARASGAATADTRFQTMVDLIKQMGINKDLALDTIDAEALRKVEAYLIEMKGNFMPYGLHTFGLSPAGDALDDTATFILKMHPERDLKDVSGRLKRSGPREIENLARGLMGQYIPPGPGNDPFRNPRAIPTGKNFYGFDPARVPSQEAYELGVRAAQQMVERTLRKKGAYPKKVAMVLWATETIRNEGINEATILHLLGMKPVWDKSGRVKGTVPIPGAQLKRPRIDVVIDASGLYRDLFPNMLQFLDDAIQKASTLTDVENLIRENSMAMKARLLQSGMSETDAHMMSRMRVFSEKPGNYGNRVVEISSASGFWESDTEIAQAFRKHTGYAFGQGKWGISAEESLKNNLQDSEIAVHSISSTVYGTMDNDDMFQYLGGLSLAISKERGEAPDTIVSLQRRPDEITVEDIGKTIGRELRTRYLNPKWIDGMKREDYAGAREMSNFVDYLWGWQVTTPFAVDDAKWRETYEVYVRDKYGMELKEFFSKTNPWAYQSITARMLEAIRKNYWKADEESRRKLAAEYAVSVVERGIACCDHTCNNPVLNRMVASIISIPGVMSPEMAEQFRLAVEKATKQKLEDQERASQEMHARVMDGFEKQTSPEKSPDKEKATDRASTTEVEGYKMEEMKTRDDSSQLPSSGVQWYAFLFVIAVLALMAIGMLITSEPRSYDATRQRSTRRLGRASEMMIFLLMLCKKLWRQYSSNTTKRVE